MGDEDLAMSYKLVVFAAILSVVAFAAPRGAEFGDDILLNDEPSTHRTMSPQVENLKKQFSALQLQMQSGEEITPAVKTLIGKMVDMVSNEIEPMITKAHESDQKLMDELMDAIDAHNKFTTRETEYLLKRAKTHRDMIGEHNAEAEKWRLQGIAYKASIPVYEATYFNRSTVCCRRDEVAVLAMEYTPAFADCDFTKPGADQCVARADAAVKKYTEEPFRAGFARYNHWHAGCNNEKAQEIADKKSMDDHDDKCDDLQADVHARKNWLDTDREEIDQRWHKVTTEYVPLYKAKRRKYTKNEVLVWDREATRKEEWKATQEIKCMLLGYQEGGSFNSKGMDECKSKVTTYHLIINYPKWVCRLNYNPVMPPYPKITDTSPWHEDCQAQEKPDNSPYENCKPASEHTAPECSNHINQNTPSGEMSMAQALALHMKTSGNDRQIGQATAKRIKHHHTGEY